MLLNNFFSLFFIFYSFCLRAESFDYHSKRDKRSYTPTYTNQINHWQDLLGGQYTLGYGYEKSVNRTIPLAVYDKTFHAPIHSYFVAKLLLATIGVNEVNLANTITIKRHIRKAQKSKAVLQLLGLTKDKKMTSQELARGGLLPPDFWRSDKINWKPGMRPTSDSPEVIPLSSMLLPEDFYSRTLRRKIAKFMMRFPNFLFSDKDPEEKEEAYGSFWEKISFVRTADGFYQLSVKSETCLAPVKVIDLRGQNSSLKRSAGWAVSTNIVKIGLGAIPIIILPQVTIALFERFANLCEVVFLIRHAMAMQLVNEALDGNEKSPFALFSENQLQAAIVYLKRTNTILSNLIPSSISAKKKIPEMHVGDINKTREIMQDALVKKGYTLIPFSNSYFTLAVKKKNDGSIKNLKVYALTQKRAFMGSPYAVVDFYKENQERVYRNFIEGGLIGINLLFLPVPMVPAILRFIYKETLVRDVHRKQMAEAGFKAHMRQNPGELKQALLVAGVAENLVDEYVHLAINMIETRKLNPLDLTIWEEDSHKEKVEAWIKKKDPTYDPSNVLKLES